jgi:hypothetical protein
LLAIWPLTFIDLEKFNKTVLAMLIIVIVEGSIIPALYICMTEVTSLFYISLFGDMN